MRVNLGRNPLRIREIRCQKSGVGPSFSEIRCQSIILARKSGVGPEIRCRSIILGNPVSVHCPGGKSGVRASFSGGKSGVEGGNPASGGEIRCQDIILARKSGVGVSFLPEKMNRHRITPTGRRSARDGLPQLSRFSVPDTFFSLGSRNGDAARIKNSSLFSVCVPVSSLFPVHGG